VVLAVFYVFGSIHHRRALWGVFVLPVVLLLIVLATRYGGPTAVPWSEALGQPESPRFWRLLHYALMLLAGVGVCVGFVASLMYLLQAHRLKAKSRSTHGMHLLSLERLEEMNRRAINLAFPLLTAGVLVGIALMDEHTREPFAGWTDPKIIATLSLWLLFATLLYLRYGFHLRGRRLALLTVLAFVLLLVTLASSHTSVKGGPP
jgi:ABC-type transport system involved in cytochrome c biogenesis permease subunit